MPMRRRLSWTMEKREALHKFSGLHFGNCYWGQWGGSKAGGEHVGRGNVAKGHECEESRWIEVSKSVIHRSIQTGWEMGEASGPLALVQRGKNSTHFQHVLVQGQFDPVSLHRCGGGCLPPFQLGRRHTESKGGR